MTLRQKQPVISDVFDQTSARFHQPLLQTGDCATLPDLLRTDQPEGGILGKLLGIVDAFVPCQAALHRLPQQVSKGQRGVLPRESVKCCWMSSPNPRRSSNSRTRIRPPSEVTRDPWNPTFKEALNES